MHEIILPDAKPALEWVNNRVVQKVSAGRRHALAQAAFASALGLWTHERGNGMAGIEWAFQVRPPGEIGRTLVPDVAFLSYERMPFEEQEALETVRIAPDVVVEVRSPGDRQRDIDEKIRVYLAAGTMVVFLVDPETKTVTVRDVRETRTIGIDDTLEYPALVGFSLPVRALFDLPRPK